MKKAIAGRTVLLTPKVAAGVLDGNDRVRVGLIGAGQRGQDSCEDFLDALSAGKDFVCRENTG